MFNCIHTVDAHALPSSCQDAFAQGEKFGLFVNWKSRRISRVEVHGRTIQKDGYVLTLCQEKVAESDSIPLDLRVTARKYDEYLHVYLQVAVLKMLIRIFARRKAGVREVAQFVCDSRYKFDRWKVTALIFVNDFRMGKAMKGFLKHIDRMTSRQVSLLRPPLNGPVGDFGWQSLGQAVLIFQRSTAR
jgi:hypothetical protein